MSDAEDQKKSGKEDNRPISPLNKMLTVGVKHTVERVTTAIPGYLLVDGCLVFKDANFVTTFAEYFVEDKIRVYLESEYGRNPVVRNLVKAIKVSPLQELPVVDWELDHKSEAIDKLVQYATLDHLIVNTVRVLYLWFLDMLNFYARRNEYHLAMDRESIDWLLQVQKSGVVLGLMSSIDSKILKNLLAGTANFGNISKLFAYVYSQEELGNFESSLSYESLAKHLFKRYESYLFVSTHPKDLEAAAQHGFKVYLCDSTVIASTLPRISKLSAFKFTGKLE